MYSLPTYSLNSVLSFLLIFIVLTIFCTILSCLMFIQVIFDTLNSDTRSCLHPFIYFTYFIFILHLIYLYLYCTSLIYLTKV